MKIADQIKLFGLNNLAIDSAVARVEREIGIELRASTSDAQKDARSRRDPRLPHLRAGRHQAASRDVACGAVLHGAGDGFPQPRASGHQRDGSRGLSPGARSWGDVSVRGVATGAPPPSATTPTPPPRRGRKLDPARPVFWIGRAGRHLAFHQGFDLAHRVEGLAFAGGRRQAADMRRGDHVGQARQLG